MKLHLDNTMRKATEAPCFAVSLRGWFYSFSAS